MKTGIELIAEERDRQVNEEGWTAAHDAEHDRGELAMAAACYFRAGLNVRDVTIPLTSPGVKIFGGFVAARDLKILCPVVGTLWPWDEGWWKPSANPIRNFVKAGALFAAEIERRLAIGEPRSFDHEITKCAAEIDAILARPILFFWHGERSEIYAAYDLASFRQHIIHEIDADVPEFTAANKGDEWGKSASSKTMTDEERGEVTVEEFIKRLLPYIATALPWQVCTCYA